MPSPSQSLAADATPRVTLVLGGQRSGKSRHAEALARASGLERVYLATAEARDEEMRERIAAHRAQREADDDAPWRTVETPVDVALALAAEAAPRRVVLVDCLTLWLSNLMEAERDIAADRRELCAALEAAAGPVILVANEVGLSTIAMHPLTRRFVDEAGRTNQAVAAVADRVIFMAAGLPLVLKGAGA